MPSDFIVDNSVFMAWFINFAARSAARPVTGLFLDGRRDNNDAKDNAGN